MDDPTIYDASDEFAFSATAHEFIMPPNAPNNQETLAEAPQTSSRDSRNPSTYPKATSISLSAFDSSLRPADGDYDSFYHRTGSFPSPNASHEYELPFPNESSTNPLKRRFDTENSSSELEDKEDRYRRSSPEPPPRKATLHNTRQRNREEDWNTHRPAIVDLYIQQNKRLEDVRAFMERQFDFKASRTAYIQHLKYWDVRKKVLSRDLKAHMWNKMIVRKEDGKDTSFRYQRALVPEHKIRRESSTYSTLASVISTPSDLSMYTPNEGSRADSVMNARHQGQNQPNASIATHQNVDLDWQHDRCLTPVLGRHQVQDLGEPQMVTSPTSIQERLDEHSWTHQHIFEELSETQTTGPLEDLLRNSRSHRANELLLEIILTKTEELTDAQSAASLETQEHAISLARSLVLQRKYWLASWILKGMCAEPNVMSLHKGYQIRLLKLRLLVDIGDDLEEPRLAANIEGSCKALLALETSEDEESGSFRCHCPSNLILAYLTRLYGIKCRDLDPFTVSTTLTSLRQQLSQKKPPLSAVRAAQQLIRFFLRKGQLSTAKRLLESIQQVLIDISLKDSRESDLNERLEKLLQLRRPNEHEHFTAPQIVDVYFKYPIDCIWLKAFDLYVRDEPHKCPDEISRPRIHIDNLGSNHGNHFC